MNQCWKIKSNDEIKIYFLKNKAQRAGGTTL